MTFDIIHKYRCAILLAVTFLYIFTLSYTLFIFNLSYNQFQINQQTALLSIYLLDKAVFSSPMGRVNWYMAVAKQGYGLDVSSPVGRVSCCRKLFLSKKIPISCGFSRSKNTEKANL